MRQVLPLLLCLVGCDVGELVVGDGGAGDPTEPTSVDTEAGSPDTDAPASPSDTDLADDTDVDTDTDADTDTAPLGDLGNPGPHQVRQSNGAFAAGGGCRLTYRRFEPQGTTAHPAAIILAHGFQRDRGKVAGWARHLATWGFEVLTPDLCHATILDADHAANGRELAALGDTHLAGRSILYMGHSAGALAALLATTTDTDALGVLGLDLVDSGDLGVGAAPSVAVPVRGLVGAPSFACNSNGNGVASYSAAPSAVAFRITDATHCDFENPTDVGCTALCGWGGFGSSVTDAEQRRVIAAMTTAWALDLGGVDARAAGYWDPTAAEHIDLRRGGALGDL